MRRNVKKTAKRARIAKEVFEISVLAEGEKVWARIKDAIAYDPKGIGTAFIATRNKCELFRKFAADLSEIDRVALKTWFNSVLTAGSYASEDFGVELEDIKAYNKMF